MKTFVRIPIIIAILFLWSSGIFAGDALYFINLGNYRLENGQVIRDCRVAYRSFGEAMNPAAKTIRAKALIIWAQQDLTVNPEPAKTLAKYLHADTFEFEGDCGHLSFLCEAEALRDTVNHFMQE